MPTALNCIIRDGALAALKRIRADHLGYIQDLAGQILFGGPARGDDGLPREMIIVLKSDDLDAARRFVEAEPYNASGEVFAEVKVRPWSQVMPETTLGALAAEIAKERAQSSRRE